MTSHDRFLQLAAAAIDAPLSTADRQRLAAHLLACRACTRDAAAVRTDALGFAELPTLVLPARRGEAILGAALTPSGGAHPMRLLLVAAALALLLVGTLAVGAQLVRRAEQLDVVPPAPSLAVVPSAPTLVSPAPSAWPERSAAPSSAAVSWTAIGSLPVAAGTIGEVAGFDGGYVAITGSGPSVWFSPDGRTWERVDLPLAEASSGANSLRAQLHGVAGRGSTAVVVGSYRTEPCASTPADEGSAACPSAPISWTSTDGRHWTSDFPGPLATAPADQPRGAMLGPVNPTVAGGWDAVLAYWDADGVGTVPTGLLHSDDGLAWAPVFDQYGVAVDLATPTGNTAFVQRGALPRTADGNWLMPVTSGDLTANGRATMQFSADAERWLDQVQLPIPADAYGSWAGDVIATGAGYVASGGYRIRVAEDEYTMHPLGWISPDGRAWTMVTPLDTREMVGMGAAIADGPAGTIGLVGYADRPSQTDVLLLGQPSTPAATPTPTPTQAPSAPLVGDIAVTVVDNLRVRSQPRISDDSAKYDPLLPVGTRLYVRAGPVSASGYEWYEVVPLAMRHRPSGWVASAGRDGEPWIAATEFECPPVPADFASLAALPPGVGWVCFPRVPITVTARLVEPACMSIDPFPGAFTPEWLNPLRYGSGVAELVAPTETNGRGCEEGFLLNLEPSGQHPDALPLGKVAEVTGMFDHPAAAACVWQGWDPDKGVAEPPVASQVCRQEFAVTRLVVSGS